MRSLLLLVVLTGTASAEWQASEVPVDAPRACMDLVGADGLPALGSHVIGRYRVKNGQTVKTPTLDIRPYGEFIPDRLGSKRGETRASFDVSIRADVKKDGGVNPDNTKYDVAPGFVRIGNLRVTTTIATTSPLAYDAVVEDMGCPDAGVTPPLAKAGDTRTLWLSTEGVGTYSFSNVVWFVSGDRLDLTYSTLLAPNVQQDDKQHPHGGVYLHVFEGLDGAPYAEERDERTFDKPLVLHDYTVEVLRVVLGPNTRRDDRWGIVTDGKLPVASILVRVTRTKVTPRAY